MRLLFTFIFYVLICCGSIACVDPFESSFNSKIKVIVVDGTISNLNEPQIIRLSRYIADSLTNRVGYSPLSNAHVEVLVDSTQLIVFKETEPGRYQAPDNFTGLASHAYQLRFSLSNGSSYKSSTEILHASVPITKTSVRFNPQSLSLTQQLDGVYPAAHDFYIDFQDPSNETNFYRWDWIDWERQEWCHSCNGGLYQVKDSQGNLVEDCVNEQYTYPHYDYNCRNQCWEILYGNNLTLFSDKFSNGKLQSALKVAQVPLYSKEHCLIEIRQSSLSKSAYTYFNQLKEQTENSGGVAGSQSALLVGNIFNTIDKAEPVVGFFTASGVSNIRYWLTRSDATGFAPGLFQALTGGNMPVNEPAIGQYRPPLAACVKSDSRTPIKPQGWQD